MLKGKKSFKLKAEKRFGITFWELLTKEFKDCKSRAEVIARFAKLTNDELTVTDVTLLKTIQKGVESREVTETDSFYHLSIKGPVGKRGKVSIKTKLESHFKKGFWEIFRDELKGCEGIEDACEIISSLTGEKVNIKPPVMIYTIRKGIEEKEVKEEDFFYNWVKPRRKHEKKEAVSVEKVKKYPINGKCKNCGHEETIGVSKRDLYVINNVVRATINIVAHKCLNCKLWATFVYKGNIEKYEIKEEILTWKLNNPHKFNVEERRAQQEKHGVDCG